jgi:hypothetical protein
VPLARLTKRVFTTDESLEADLEVRDREVERQENQAARHRARARGDDDG